MGELLSFDASGAQFAWDSTSLSNYVTCPRKYFYTNLQGWQSEIRSAHLIFGGHYAAALEQYHKHRAAGVDYDDAVRTVLRDLLLASWEGRKFHEDGSPVVGSGKPQEFFHNIKSRDTLVRSVIWYLDQFKDDAMPTVILQDGRAAVEYSFALELSDNYIYCGHIDRLVEYSGGVYVQDQKTTGTVVSAKFFSDFSPDYQMSGYTWAGQIIFDIPVSGVVIDAAQIAVGFTRFSRGFVPRPIPVLEEFRHEVLHWIAAANRDHAAGEYPMNRKSCGNYGGCEFRSICSALPVHREALLAASFVKRDRWDPLVRR